MKITVPATSANIGPGFDSVGVAVSKYLTIEVLEQQMHGISNTIWEIFLQMKIISSFQQPCK